MVEATDATVTSTFSWALTLLTKEGACREAPTDDAIAAGEPYPELARLAVLVKTMMTWYEVVEIARPGARRAARRREVTKTLVTENSLKLATGTPNAAAAVALNHNCIVGELTSPGSEAIVISHFTATDVVSSRVGTGTGFNVGVGIGMMVGFGMGSLVGAGTGSFVGVGTGSSVGAGIGIFVGAGIGSFMGTETGSFVGIGTGSFVGTEMGSFVGAGRGNRDGCRVGCLVGTGVGDDPKANSAALKISTLNTSS